MSLAIIVVITFVDLGIIFHHLKPTLRTPFARGVVNIMFRSISKCRKGFKSTTYGKNFERLLSKSKSLQYDFEFFGGLHVWSLNLSSYPRTLRKKLVKESGN